ncbi:hypothetical protein E2C01_080179 [Portunus trituberculatus]|uniref:Uncharacterized protein n=1 Tax=Portunus trituberculatus TaxID=210409 RepID=A0A5B7IVB6_PORTR|nr:hypothetical protein [Portunus trituberculatus]
MIGETCVRLAVWRCSGVIELAVRCCSVRDVVYNLSSIPRHATTACTKNNDSLRNKTFCRGLCVCQSMHITNTKTRTCRNSKPNLALPSSPRPYHHDLHPLNLNPPPHR